jgi:hypothetical protein
MNDALPNLTGDRDSPDRVEKRTVSKRRKLFLWLSISAFPLTLLAALVFRSETSCHPDYQNSCINTLLQIEGAKEQWALETNSLTDHRLPRKKWQNISKAVGRPAPKAAPISSDRSGSLPAAASTINAERNKVSAGVSNR